MAIRNTQTSASVNNGRLQPLQGMDTIVYIQDQSNGKLIQFGEFTGFQYTIRNATEPYLPLGHRTLTLLDGEIQIGWVAEQGKINLDALPQIMGYNFIGPTVRIGRSPRFQIVVEYRANELDQKVIRNQAVLLDGDADATRAAIGRYVFSFCKVDAFTSGAMAGRTVIADRIEGLAEGWAYEPFTSNDAPLGEFQQDSASVADYNGYRITSPVIVSSSTTPGWAADVGPRTV